jgi:low temperature requirement protein LtrA
VTAAPPPAEPDPAAEPAPEPAAGPDGAAAEPDDPSQRVTTLELFFDLVFAFTLTQLTSLLSSDESLTGLLQVLMIFAALWWMYGGYAWLTNSRPPVHTAERVLMLVGMAGFLIAGLAIPHSFGSDGVAFGLGFGVVAVVHAVLYIRVNRRIVRIAPFNIASAVLIVGAGLAARPSGAPSLASYLLWAVALVVLLGSPLVAHPTGAFHLRPAHFVERYGALLIVALGESVAAVGIGSARFTHSPPVHGSHLITVPGGRVSGQLLLASVLGLALAALLWWAIFGDGSDEQARDVMTAASARERISLALSAYFYGNIPLLLGVIGIAAGVQQVVERSSAEQASVATTRGAIVLACGVALFLAGDVAFRRLLGNGPALARTVAAAAALATIAAGALVSVELQLALLVLILAAMLITERQENPAERPESGSGPADAGVTAG